jgi:hypothetical protein
LGFAVLLCPPSAWLTCVQIALISGFTVILAVHAPLLLAHPFGVLLKNIPLVTLLLCAWFVHRHGWTLTSEWLLRAGITSIWITEGRFPKILS